MTSSSNDLAARTSHEVRTSLHSLLFCTDFLLTDPSEPLTPGQEKQVRKLQSHAWHLASLVDRLLELTKSDRCHSS